jgi:predicted PurR-regulated permease PerM
MTFTRRALVAVAFLTLAALIAAAAAHLLTGLLLIFAGALVGIWLNQAAHGISALSHTGYKTSFAIVVVALAALATGLLFFMGARIGQQVSEFSEQFNQAFQQAITRYQELLSKLGLAAQQQNEQSNQLPRNWFFTAASALALGVSALGGFVLVLFMGFYFAMQPQTYRHAMLALHPPRYRARAGDILDKLVRTLWWWFLGRLLGMFLIAVGATIGLWLLGIPLPLTQGAIAGLLNFVPNVGPLIAAVPPILFGLQQGGNVALYVALFFLALQFVESYLITPLIDQRQVQLPPALTLAAQLLLGMLAGFLGMLLATPLTATAVTLIRELYVKRLDQAQT